MPGTSDLTGSLQDSERQAMLLQPRPSYQSADPSAHHEDIISVSIGDGGRIVQDVMIEKSEESKSGDQDPAQGDGEEDVEEVTETGKQDRRE